MPLVAMRPVGLAAIVAELALFGAVKSCCRGSDRVRSRVDVKLKRLDREKAIGEVWRMQGDWLSTAASKSRASSTWCPIFFFLPLLLFYPSIAVNQLPKAGNFHTYSAMLRLPHPLRGVCGKRDTRGICHGGGAWKAWITQSTP